MILFHFDWVPYLLPKMRSNNLPGYMVFILLTACSTADNKDQPSANMVITTPTPLVLFADDFSDPSSGWNIFKSDDVIREYVDDEFRTFVDNAKNKYRYPIASIDRTFGDVRLMVDFRRVSGIDATRAHLVCRYAAERNYVFGSIDFQGEAQIGTRLDDMQEIVANAQDVEITPHDMNTMRLDCIGDTISLYINGDLVVSSPVEAEAEGAVGFAAGGATDGPTDIRFDNFIVYPGD